MNKPIFWYTSWIMFFLCFYKKQLNLYIHSRELNIGLLHSNWLHLWEEKCQNMAIFSHVFAFLATLSYFWEYIWSKWIMVICIFVNFDHQPLIFEIQFFFTEITFELQRKNKEYCLYVWKSLKVTDNSNLWKFKCKSFGNHIANGFQLELCHISHPPKGQGYGGFH